MYFFQIILLQMRESSYRVTEMEVSQFADKFHCTWWQVPFRRENSKSTRNKEQPRCLDLRLWTEQEIFALIVMD